MKKTYINLEMKIVKIEGQTHMLAGSLTPGSGTGTINPTPAPGGVDAEGRDDDNDW